jgi:hypothetical protein
VNNEAVLVAGDTKVNPVGSQSGKSNGHAMPSY